MCPKRLEQSRQTIEAHLAREKGEVNMHFFLLNSLPLTPLFERTVSNGSSIAAPAVFLKRAACFWNVAPGIHEGMCLSHGSKSTHQVPGMIIDNRISTTLWFKEVKRVSNFSSSNPYTVCTIDLPKCLSTQDHYHNLNAEPRISASLTSW